MANRWGNNGNSERLYIRRLQNHCQWWLQQSNYKMLACLKKSYENLAAFLKAEILLCRKKFSIMKAMLSPVVMYGCDSCTIKNGDQWRIDGFELWCWTRLLRVPWTTRRSNKSMLKEINLEYSLEGAMLKLKLQYFGQLMWRNYSLEKPYYWERLKAGGEEDDRRWDGWMESPTRWTWVCSSSRSWWRTASPGMLQSMGLQRVGHDWVTELNWTYHIANTICGWHVSPARLGLPKAPTHIPIKFAPMHRSQCLAFTRYSVSLIAGGPPF